MQQIISSLYAPTFLTNMCWKKQLFILLMCFYVNSVSGSFFSLWTESNSIIDEEKTGMVRGKKKKYLYSLMVTILMVKAVVLPIMFKTMAVMTSISVLLSLLSLTVSSIIGFTKHALYHIQPSYKVFHIGAGVKGIGVPHEPIIHEPIIHEPVVHEAVPYHHEELGDPEHEFGEHHPFLDRNSIF